MTGAVPIMPQLETLQGISTPSFFANNLPLVSNWNSHQVSFSDNISNRSLSLPEHLQKLSVPLNAPSQPLLEKQRLDDQLAEAIYHNLYQQATELIQLTQKQTSSSSEENDCLSSIQESCQYLICILDFFLFQAQMRARFFKPLPKPCVNFSQIFQFVYGLEKKVAEQKELELSLAPLEENLKKTIFSGYPTLITMVLLNLVGNSLKFTPKGGKITLKVDVRNDTPEKTELTISVSDTGIGISDEQLSRLFKPFEQAEVTTSSRYGGTGLGLNLCKTLVEEMMEGKLDCQSKLQEGSTFSFTLTLNKVGEKDRQSIPLLTLPSQWNMPDKSVTFWSRMAHEIRNPLSGIVGNCEQLENDTSDKALQEYAQTMQKTTKTLLRQLEHVLLYSKVDAGKLIPNPTQFWIHEFLSSTALYEALEKRGIKSSLLSSILTIILPSLKSPSSFIGDTHLLRFIIIELLTNALEHSQEEVILSCMLSDKEDRKNELIFKVADKGSGLPQKSMERFNAYAQSPATQPLPFEGLHIDLALCAKLVALLNGEISMSKGRENKGVMVTLKLPFAFAALPSPELERPFSAFATPLPKAKNPWGKWRVLYAEDTPVIQKIVQKIFSKVDCALDMVSDGQEAWKMLEASPTQWQLFITDNGLPGLTGREIVQKMKQHTTLKDLPVILASGEELTLNEAKSMGFNDYLVKPLKAETLLPLVAKTLAN